jgi:hypothetical protein
MEIEGSLPCSQQPGLGPSSKPNMVDSQPSYFYMVLFIKCYILLCVIGMNYINLLNPFISLRSILIVFSNVSLDISSDLFLSFHHLRLGIPTSLFHSNFFTNIFCMNFSSIHAKILTPLILLHFIIILGPNWQEVQIMNLLSVSFSRASF